MRLSSRENGHERSQPPTDPVRRAFLVEGVKTAFALGMLYAVGGCSKTEPVRDPAILSMTNATNADETTRMEDLPCEANMMGRRCSIVVTDPDGKAVTLPFEFRDVDTLVLDGDTHTLERIMTGNKSTKLSDTIPVLNVPARDLIQRMNRTENGDVRLESEFGHVTITEADFRAMLTSLRYASSEASASQTVEVPVDVRLSRGTQLTVDGAIMMGIVDADEFSIPNRCSVHVTSKRIERPTAPVAVAETPPIEPNVVADWIASIRRRMGMKTAPKD